MDAHLDNVVDTLVGGGDVSLSSRDILKWSEGVSVHAPDLSAIREQTERSLDMRELNSALDEIGQESPRSTSMSSAHSNSQVSDSLALSALASQDKHYSEAHAPTLDALEGRGPTPSSAAVNKPGSSAAGSADRSSLRDSSRDSVRDRVRDSVSDGLRDGLREGSRHSMRQSSRESLLHSRRHSGDSNIVDEQSRSSPAQALRTSSNGRSSTSGLGASSFSTPPNTYRAHPSYRERSEKEVPSSLRKSPAVSARLSAQDSPASRHARRGSSPFSPPCAPDASMLDATFHPPEIGDRTYDVSETAVTTNMNRRKGSGLENSKALVAESAARLSPSTSPIATSFPSSNRKFDLRERSAATMDKSTFIRRVREDSESPSKETSLLDTKSFASTPPQERRDALAPLPSARATRYTTPSAPRFQQPDQTDRTVDLGRLVNRQQEASRLPGNDSIMGSDLADLSIDSQEEMVPASSRPRPSPPSSSMRNLTQQLDSRTITEQSREREQQRELARARSLANSTRASSMRSLDARSPRVERTANAEVPISKRREQPSAVPTPGRRMSTMAPSNGQRASAASRGPLGFPRSTVPRDLASGTGPSRMSAPATSFTKRTSPPSESARRSSALPSSSSSRRSSTAPSSSTLSRRLSAVPTSSVPDTPRRQSTSTRRQSMSPPRNERAQAANERSQPSRTSTISRTESMQSVRRQSTSMTRTNSWNSQGEPEPRGGRKSMSPECSERRQSVSPRSGSAQSQERESGHRSRPSSSAVIGERKSAGIPRTTTSRNLATSPVKRASAPPTSTAREALGARRSLAPAPTAGPTPSTKRHSMLPSTRSTATSRKFAETPASKVPERRERKQPQNARTRSDTTSAVSAAPSTVPSSCSAPTIDSRSSKSSAPSSEADVEWLPPLPEASFECKPAVTSTHPTPAKSVSRPKTETTSRIARRESRPNLASDSGARGIPRSQSRESQQSGSGSERDAQRQRNTLAVSGNSRVSGASGSSAERRVSWNESSRAPIRSGHVEEMRTKYGHRTASGRSVGAEVAVDEMGRAVSGRVQASTVGSSRRFR